MTSDHRTAPAGTAESRIDRGGIISGIGAIAVGAAVIPYGMSMPTMGDGQPGPGLFPMLIGGLLVLFGILLILTTVISGRRAARQAPTATTDQDTERGADAGTDRAIEPESPESQETVESAGGARSVLTDDIGADGPRRWVNAAVVLGAVLAFIPLTPVLGFPISMFLVVATILLTLRTRWWVALVVAACASLTLWAMFEQGLMVQLPDGFLEGF